MFTIGLTGGIGSGKSTVADLFAQHGISIVDADAINRELTKPNTTAFKQILLHFGQSILNEHGQIERGKLRKIIFNDLTERQWLENLLHPLIRQAMLQARDQSTSPYCILVIPLLSESKGIGFIDRVCVIDASEQLQLKNASLRDNCDPKEIKQIILSQHARSKRLQIADDIIENNKNIDHLKQQVDTLHQTYLTLANNKDTA